MEENKMTKCFSRIQVPHGLGVRISDFHSDGPGSIPGVGVVLTIFKANPPYGWDISQKEFLYFKSQLFVDLRVER